LAAEAIRLYACTVEAVPDGAAAILAVKNGRFDLIFLDIHMPRVGGLEAASNIREWEVRHGRSRTPIVALTASAMQHEQKACFTNGMDDVLLKPFRLEALGDMLEKWCPE
jgi:CheY-like chemotaxis protein